MAHNSNAPIDYRCYGRLAHQVGFLQKNTVMRSAAGFYIGTADEHQLPLSRESVEYFESYKAASHAFAQGDWTQLHID